MNKYKNKVIIYIICLVLLAILGVSFAYFSAIILGSESISTLSINTGKMEIEYEDGDPAIVLNGIYPRDKEWATKDFTVTGTNTTAGLIANYDIYLVIDNNTFFSDAFAYQLTSEGDGAAEGYIEPPIYAFNEFKVNKVKTELLMSPSFLGPPYGTQQFFPSESEVYIGTGYFRPNSNIVHSYTLKLYYYDNGVDQTEDEGASFAAHIEIREAGSEDGKNYLAGRILSDNVVKTPLTIPGRQKSLYTFEDSTLGYSSVEYEYHDYYLTYGTSYEENTDGTFNLTGVNIIKWDDVNLSNIDGLYIVSSKVDENSSNLPEMVTYTNLDTIYVVDNVFSDFKTDSVEFSYYSQNSSKSEAVLASTPDDYGTSYYFRGSVKNNYVVYNGECYRIVRVLGNSTVKLIKYSFEDRYSDDICRETPGVDISLNKDSSYYNSDSSENRYIGMFYSYEDGSYLGNHENYNTSNLYYSFDDFDDNLIVADTIWCNDKSTYSGLGYGTEPTIYSANNRIFANGNYKNLASPSLVCPNDNLGGNLSKLTKEDVKNGNGNAYKLVGTLTADELAFAGATYESENSGFYLASNSFNNPWWTISPSKFNSKAEVFTTYKGGLYSTTVDEELGVRQAITLKYKTTVTSGNGTINNPYIIYYSSPL